MGLANGVLGFGFRTPWGAGLWVRVGALGVMDQQRPSFRLFVFILKEPYMNRGLELLSIRFGMANETAELI